MAVLSKRLLQNTKVCPDSIYAVQVDRMYLLIEEVLRTIMQRAVAAAKDRG